MSRLLADIVQCGRAELSEWAGCHTPLSSVVLHFLKETRRKDVLFIHVPKNGGTSISFLLYGEARSHHTARFYKRTYGRNFDSIQSFAVLRDPVDRFLSTYRFIMNGGSDLVPLNQYWCLRTRHIKTIDDYIDFLKSYEGRLHKLDSVMRPQCHYVLDDNGEVIPSRLFMLSDKAAVSEFLGQFTRAPLPYLNVTPGTKHALTPSQKSAIEHLYRDDFSLIDHYFRSGQNANVH